MDNKLGVSVVYCKVSGFKLVAYTDFNGLLINEAINKFVKLVAWFLAK